MSLRKRMGATTFDAFTQIIIKQVRELTTKHTPRHKRQEDKQKQEREKKKEEVSNGEETSVKLLNQDRPIKEQAPGKENSSGNGYYLYKQALRKN